MPPITMADVCVSCSSPIPEGARFCMNCGQPVPGGAPDVAAAADQRHAALAAAAPRSLVEKLRAPRLTGERKPVTALFADVVGSTTLAESMDPEEFTAIINGAFEVMSQAIHRYEGTIAKLLGDAVLAFFGAPIAHEDDPARAARAALDLIEGVRSYAGPLRESGIDLQVRVGINTGPVIVGNVGSDLRYEYTALGDAVNVAARMQTAAEPGHILLTDATYRFVAPLVEVRDLGPIEVKGKAEPVRAYELLGLRAEAGPTRGLGAAGIESPMVGRSGPLAQLVGALDAVRAGRGRVAVIVGEPGIGKSRLLAEFRQAAQAHDRPAAFAVGHSLSYGQGLPYHLLTDLVRSLIGAPMAVEEREVREALARTLPALLGADAPEAEALLGHLLGAPVDSDVGRAVAAYDPLTLQAGYLKAIRAVVGARAARGPLVLVLEDIHWADPTSAEAIWKLLGFVQLTPVLLVCLTRPDREAPGWRLVGQARDLFGDAMVEIALAPLTEDESRTLVANLLEIESLPARTREFILARAEGNPFFVEEVIRMLIDRGAIVRRGEQWVATAEVEAVEIPDTLQGLLLARIDRLPEDARRTLRVASVIGRQFSARVLQEVLEEATAQ